MNSNSSLSLQILGRASSINVRKVQWTCDEIAIPYAREDWGTGFRSTKEPVIKGGDFGRNCGGVGSGFRAVVPAPLHFDSMQQRRP